MSPAKALTFVIFCALLKSLLGSIEGIVRVSARARSALGVRSDPPDPG